MDHARASSLFHNFVQECTGSSELYASLSTFIASDPELLDIASNAGEGQPVPNLLFGAVHYLLLKDSKHELAAYYASLSDSTRPIDTELYTLFKMYCLDNRSGIIHLIQTRLVQTNEAGRAAYLYPCFCLIHEIAAKPLALVEIGTSAGLQLLWDKYSYSYSHEPKAIYGYPHSAVHIHSEIRGSVMPFLQREAPPVASKWGIDLHINHMSDEDNRVWLQALIWPEHADRRELLGKAATIAAEQTESLNLIQGDAITNLPALVEQIADDEALCIFHTHVANQFTPQAKLQLLEYIRELGARRDVFHLYNNMYDGQLHLDCYISGEHDHRVLANTEGHGRWFEWLRGQPERSD